MNTVQINTMVYYIKKAYKLHALLDDIHVVNTILDDLVEMGNSSDDIANIMQGLCGTKYLDRDDILELIRHSKQ